MLYKDFLAQLSECPFCTGKNKVVLKGEHCYLTYALAPYHKHHLLVVPSKHVESISELTSEETADILVMQNRALNLLRKLKYNDITLLMREGHDINKTVAHVHFHAIPNCRIGDLDHYGQERRILEEEEINQVLNDINQVLH